MEEKLQTCPFCGNVMNTPRQSATYPMETAIAALPFDLALSTRPSNALLNSNIITLGDLVKETKWTLLRIPNFGRVSLLEVTTLLSLIGLSLASSDHESQRHLVANPLKNHDGQEELEVRPSPFANDAITRQKINEAKCHG